MLDYIFVVLLLIIIISFSISILVTSIKNINLKFNVSERTIITNSVGWCLVIYGLILGFAITSFYNRYVEIRTIITTKASSFEILFNFLKTEEKSESRDNILKLLSTYLSTIIKYNNVNDYEKIHNLLNNSLIQYVKNNPTKPYNIRIINDLSTEQQLKKIFDEINISNFYLSILLFLFIIVLIPIMFTTTSNILVQFIIDFCVITILVSGLCLAYFLANPFVSSPISINLSLFEKLSKEINEFIA